MPPISQHGDEDVNVVLVGNKVDLESKRKVSYEEGVALSKEFGVEFFEVSARKDTNVKESFRCLAEKALKAVLVPKSTGGAGGVKIDDKGKGKSGGCCGGGGSG